MATAAVLAAALTDHAARAYGLFLNGMDVLKEPAATSRYGVDIGTISVTVNAAGGVSRMKFTIDDPAKLITVTDGDTVRFYDLTTGAPLFVGWVEHYHIVPDFGTLARSIAIDAVGPESQLDWAVTTSTLIFYGATLPTMIQGIVANAAGISELRALVDPVNAQGSQALPIGSMASVTGPGGTVVYIDVETGFAPWVAGVITGFVNTMAVAAASGDAPPGGGANSVFIGTSGISADQMAYVPLPGTFTAGINYFVSFWSRYQPAGSAQALAAIFGSSATVADRATTIEQATAGWVKRTVSWTPTADRTDAVLALYVPGTFTANGFRVDLVTVTSGGPVVINAGTPVREAVLQAAAACVTSSFLGVNLTVDHTFGLRAWAVLPTLTQPSDVTTPITVDQGGVNKPSDESYDVDAAGIIRGVLVIGVDGVPLALVNDGTGKAGRVTVLSDDTLTTIVNAIAAGQAYLNDYRVGLRGSLGLEDVSSGPSAAIDVLRQIVLTDPSTRGTGTYEISSIGFTYYGTKRDAVVAFGGLPPSGAALIRRLTRDTLS